MENRNPNWEMTPKKIKEVTDALDKAKDSYEVFGILATDDEIDKNHSLQWLAGYYAKRTKNK